MADAVGNLFVRLGMNMRDFLSKRARFKRSLRGMARDAQRTARMVKTAFVGIIAGAAVKKTIDLAREQVKQERKLSQVIKATGGAAGFTAKEMQEYASQLQNATNFGDETTLAAMSVMATFRNVAGDTFKEAISLAQDMASTFETDLSSASMQLGKALNDPLTGLMMLTRVGITFNESQKAQIKAFAQSGQLAKAQGVILSELANQFGGVAAAVADTGIQARNALGDLMEAIGEPLMILLDNAAKRFADLFTGITRDAQGTVTELGLIAGAINELMKMKMDLVLGGERIKLTLQIAKEMAIPGKASARRESSLRAQLAVVEKEQLAVKDLNIFDVLEQQRKIANVRARNAAGGSGIALKQRNARMAAAAARGGTVAGSIGAWGNMFAGGATRMWDQMKAQASYQMELRRRSALWAEAYRKREEAAPRDLISTQQGYERGSARAQSLLARLQAASINRGLSGMDPAQMERKRTRIAVEKIADKDIVIEVSPDPV